MSERDIVVVGGGILGAALTYELAQRAFRVTLLEARALGSGATSGFAWINATAKTDEETYHRLNAQGVAHYDTLAEAFGAAALGLRGGGALFWADGADEAGRNRLRQRAARLQDWGYPAVVLSREEMQALEPQARFSEGAEGLFAPADKWVDTPRLTRFFAERAQERGAEVRPYCPALGFSRSITQAISTVETPQGRIATRQLVITAGLHTPALIAQLTEGATGGARIALRREPGLLVETPPGSAPLLRRVLYPPDTGGLHLRPTPEGGLLLGADDTDAALSGETEADIPRDAPFQLLQRAARALPALPLESLSQGWKARVCVRPVPADDRPVVGALLGVPGVFLAMTHSGVTLGPLLARLLADEIVTGRVASLLLPYRPL